MPLPTYIEINRVAFELYYGRTFVAGDASENITLRNYGDFRLSTSHIRVLAGGGNDTIDGGAGVVNGGDGNDRFLNNGTSVDDIDRIGASMMYGGKGNDRFEDMYGSSDYFGGVGEDVFSTYQGTIRLNHSFEGDVDRAWLGSGDDTAQVAINANSYSGIGIRPELRTIEIDGGTGNDRFVYHSNDIFGAIYGDRNGLLDMRRADEGSLRLHNTEITDFETFDITAILGRVSTIRLGAGNDRIVMTSAMEGIGLTDKAVRVFLDAGNDLAIGTNGWRPEVIDGGAGNDLLISDGAVGHGGMDTLIGGDGNDVLTTTAQAVGNARAHMFGGAGRDLFVISQGYSTNQVLRDFVQGEDRIVLNSSRAWTDGTQTTAADIRGAINPGRDMTVLIDSDRWLHLVTDRQETSLYLDAELRYDRDTGKLWVRAVELDNPFATESEWSYRGRVQGALDLGQDDFAFL